MRRKSKAGVGGAMIGWILALVKFDPAAAPTPALIQGVYAMNIWIPLAMFVIMLLLLSRYDLDDIYQGMVEKHAAAAKADSAQ